MKKEELDLICKDICARIPYGVICKIKSSCAYEDGRVRSVIEDKILNSEVFNDIEELYSYKELDEIKPYLRPLSSMTEEEMEELRELCGGIVWTKDILHDEVLNIYYRHDALDWLLKHHFDTRGLIEMGLALEAPEEMYKEE